MASVHGSSIVDRDPLIQLIFRDLKNSGFQLPKLETPKPPKRSRVPFSTPGGSSAPPPSGRLFGKRLTDLSKLLVSLDGQNDIFVPKFVVSACTYIEKNLGAEGLYRLSGSSARQKKIRTLLESTEQDLVDLSPAPSVLDVASLLKQFLRELPLPLLPTNLGSLLTEASNKDVSFLLLAVLVVPPEHLSCLSYLCRHFAAVAQSSSANKMNAKNLAIVLTPSLFPLQETVTSASVKEKRLIEGDLQLKAQTAIVESLIENASQVGYVSAELYDRYLAHINQPVGSTSEDNLDEECGPSKRKSKKRVRRRSGSLSRVLGIMGKGIRAMTRAYSPSKGPDSVHSTPLPQFGNTPEFPSPRASQPKRKATADHELSPSNKSQKRGLESTFTPKMRTRTFSVKRFKRKKSEGKMMSKEALIVHTHFDAATPPMVIRRSSPAGLHQQSSPTTNTKGRGSTNNLYKAESMEWEVEDKKMSSSQFEEDYAEMKAHYEDLKKETRMLEAAEASNLDKENIGGGIQAVQDRFDETLANGSILLLESKATSDKLARVKRRSAEPKKPRSPSQRRIGVIRRRSREREERGKASPGSAGPSPRERGRSPGPKRRSPKTKASLTPHIDESCFNNRLQRGKPNSTNSGLEKPSPVAYMGPQGKMRIKNSLKSREKPAALRAILPLAASQDEGPRRSPRNSGKKLSQSESIASLRHELKDMIEKSFSASGSRSCSDGSSNDDVFSPLSDSVDGEAFAGNWDGTNIEIGDAPEDVFELIVDAPQDVFELSSKMSAVSFVKKPDDESSHSLSMSSDVFLKNPSPITRSQLRRQSASFEFSRPTMSVVKKHDGIRRQSSAFEFRTQPVEPVYENLSRDVATRASLRRRNSSVRDLIQKMEKEARRCVIGPSSRLNDVKEKQEEEEEVVPGARQDNKTGIMCRDANLLETNFDEADTTKRSMMGPPSLEAASRLEVSTSSCIAASSRLEASTSCLVRTPSPPPGLAQETWIDGSEFFKNVLQVEAGPVCGRSSIVKIRKENRGRVLDSVNKFSGATPSRHAAPPPPGTRRMSARMGICGASPSLPPPTTRRQTLTGIKTSAGPRNSAHYAAQTVSTLNKRKSPAQPPATGGVVKVRKSPSVRTHLHFDSKRRRSPNPTINKRTAGKPEPTNKPAMGVRRTVSNPKKTRKDRANRKNNRRFLTIGYTDEVRSPLRECSNIQANIKRSNSDQTPASKKETFWSGTNPAAAENAYQNIQVYRTRSLKCESVSSSPGGGGGGAGRRTPNHDRVRRALSDRATPRQTVKVASSSVHKGLFRGDIVAAEDSSLLLRRSPRLGNIK